MIPGALPKSHDAYSSIDDVPENVLRLFAYLNDLLVQEGVELRGEMPNRYSQRHFKPFESLRIMILYHQETHAQNNFAGDDE